MAWTRPCRASRPANDDIVIAGIPQYSFGNHAHGLSRQDARVRRRDRDVRTIHNKAAIHILQFAHDRDRRARHIDYDRRDITFRSIVQQAVVDVFLLQNIYSDGV